MKELTLSCIIKKKARGGYSALCPELDVASRGDTIEEAKQNLTEAITGHLQTAREEGLIDDILKRLGLTKKDLTQKTRHIELVSFSTPITVSFPV